MQQYNIVTNVNLGKLPSKWALICHLIMVSERK
jgi:hypothetical protein